MSEAERIYSKAVSRAMADHRRMVRRFMRGEIEIASPCGLDRERQYIVAAFDKALAKSGSTAKS